MRRPRGQSRLEVLAQGTVELTALAMESDACAPPSGPAAAALHEELRKASNAELQVLLRDFTAQSAWSMPNCAFALQRVARAEDGS